MESCDYLNRYNKKIEITPLFICSIDKCDTLFDLYGDINMNKESSDIFICSNKLSINSNPVSSFSKTTYKRLLEGIDCVLLGNSFDEKVYIYIGKSTGKWYEVEIKKDPNNKDRVILVWFYSVYIERSENSSLNEFIFSGEKGVVLAFEDLTLSKREEFDNTIKKEKMKTEFFADVSHELRTPLNVILGAIQLLSFQMDKGSISDKSDKLDEYLSIIKFNALRLLRLVNNIIDLTKLDSGFHDLELRKCNIVSFVEEITNSVIPCMEGKGINLTFDTSNEEIFTLIDPSKMERVILNLLSNAIKFTPNGGEVFVKIILEEDIKISVKDSGIGMNEDKLKLIFERFKQINDGYIKANEGSGIGLSLAKSIVEQHGGYINVESSLGLGSEFTILIPRSDTNIDSSEFSLYEFQLESVDLELSDICYQK